MSLNKIYDKLKKYKEELEKASNSFMNGTNSEPDGSKEEKIVHSRIPKDVATMGKEEGPDLASPGNEKGDANENKRRVTHDECGRPFAKDDIDKKIQAKFRAAMDKKGFGEADATRHVIDRDKGEKEAVKPKQQPLLQTELIKFDNNGQWSLNKSNYGPKDMGLYNAKDNIKRKSGRTGVEVEGAGGNRAQKEWASGGRDSTKSPVARQAKVDQEKSAASPVKVFSEEEKAKLQTQYDTTKKVDYNGNMKGGNENDEG